MSVMSILRSNRLTRFAEVPALVILYLIMGVLGELSCLKADTPLMWPATGVAIAYLLKRGLHLWPGVFLASFLTEVPRLTAAHSLPSLSLAELAIGLAIGSTGQIFLASFVIAKTIGLRELFNREANIIAFTFISFAAGVAEASWRSALLFLFGFPSALQHEAWEAACISQFLGILIAAPLVLSIWEPRVQASAPSRRLEAGLLALLLLTACYKVYRGPLYHGDNYYSVMIPMLTLHIWVTLRFGLIGTTCSMAVVSAFSIWGTKDGFGLFYRENINESIFLLHNYAAWIAIACLTQVSARRRRDQIEDELRENMTIYQTIFDEAPTGKVQLDIKSKRFLRANRHFSEIIGYPTEELLAMTFFDITFPVDAPKGGDWLDHLLATEKAEYNTEQKFLRRNGSTFWGIVNATVIKNHKGEALYFIATVHDRTTIREAEDRLHVSEERARLAVEAAALGTFDHNLMTDTLFLSEEARKMLGALPTCQLGLSDFLRVLHPADRRLTEAALRRSWSQTNAGPYRVEFRCLDNDGQGERALEMNGLTLFDKSGKALRVTGIIQDISEKKKTIDLLQHAKEAAENANRLKSQFLANMSHEIRTPITAILSFSGFLREPQLSELEKDSFIDVITRNGQQLVQLIDDILDLSKIEAGRLHIERQVTSLHSLLGDVVMILRIECIKQGLTLVLPDLANTPDTILTDPIRLRQILTNIMGNAIKFTPREGRVSLQVNTKSSSNPPDTLIIEFVISDTGCGIAPEHQKKLFVPFMQADASTTRRFGGTGLGLILARRLARGLGGDVVLRDSTVGGGSTFVVTIKTCLAVPQPPVIAKTAADNSSIDQRLITLQGASILVAEDKDDIQLMIKRYLEQAGAHVDFAGNGRDAVAYALAKHYDFVLMDIQMPIIDGYEATRQLRARGYDRPIIVLTSHAMKEEREKSFAAGCNAHLNKPIQQAELVALLAEYYS